MNIPSMVVIRTNDNENLPAEMLGVVCANLFAFNMREMEVRGEDVLLHLNYTPKMKSLQKKLMQLPVSFHKVKASTKRELDLFCEAVKRFKIQPVIEEEEDEPKKKKKRIFVDEDDEDEEEIRKNKKIKLFKNKIVKPSTSSVLDELVEELDIDADDFCAQKYTIKNKT